MNYLPLVVLQLFYTSVIMTTELGRNMKKHNIAGYTAYNKYMSMVESIFANKTIESYEFAFQYNKTNQGMILPQITPDKLLFFQLLYSFNKGESDLDSLLITLTQYFPIIDPIELQRWMNIHFDFPPNIILTMVQYIARKNIVLTKGYTQQILYLSEKYHILERFVEARNNEGVRWLLENGLIIKNTEDVLEKVWRYCDVNVIITFIEHAKMNKFRMSKEIINGLHNNETILHTAVLLGNKIAVHNLLQYLDADINSKDAFGKTPLYRAVESNKIEMIELLINMGSKDDENFLLLEVAILQGNLGAVSVLIKHKTINETKENSSPSFNFNYTNPLFLTVERNNVDILKMLASISYFKKLLNSTNDFGDTLMHIASSKGFLQSVITLKTLGVIYDSRNNYGETPLYKAVENGNLDVIKELIINGADVNTKTDLGDSLFHLAASKGRIDIAKLLVQNQIKTNQKNSIGEIPFDKAEKLGKIEMMNFLISIRADISEGEMTIKRGAANDKNNCKMLNNFITIAIFFCAIFTSCAVIRLKKKSDSASKVCLTNPISSKISTQPFFNVP